MGKKKTMTILLGTLGTLALLGVGGYAIVSEQVGNYMLEKMLETQLTDKIAQQVGIDLHKGSQVLTDEQLAAFAESLDLQAIKGETGVPDTVQEKQTGDTQTEQADEPSQQAKQQQAADEEPIEVEDTVAKEATDSGESTHQDSVPSEVTQPEVTTDDLMAMVEAQVEAVAQSVPSADKRAMTQLVLDNLAMSDINYLVSLVLDGVSASDLNEAKDIAYRSFSAEELEVVRMYYTKYSHLIP